MMILLISGVIIPAFIWLLLYCNIIDQCVTIDEEVIVIETKAEAQRDVLRHTVKNPFFWIYALYSTSMIFAGLCSVNAFYLGDWYFSL